MTADTPSEYPIGELMQKLPEDVRKWVVSQDLETKSNKELHDLLIKGRQQFKLPPWTYLTPILQSYGVASVKGTPEASTGDASWCVCRGTKRPLSVYEHTFTGAKEVWVKLRSGDTISVGWFIPEMDGNPVFAFWTFRTERLILDCSVSGMAFAHPLTGEYILSGIKLSKWQDYLQFNDTILIPATKHHADSKCSLKRAKQAAPMDVIPPPEPRSSLQKWRPKRLHVLQLISTIMTPEIMSVNLDPVEGKKEAYEELCGLLRITFDMYVKRLQESRVVEPRIPSDVILTCKSLLNLYSGNEGLYATMKFWLESLLDTDETRKD